MSTEAYKRERHTSKGIIERVNAVKNFVMSPCDAEPLVYVETVFKPAGNLIITLLSFGMDDVVRGYIRPKASRRQKRYRGPKGRTVRIRGKKVRLSIPELGNEIGRRLKAEHDVFKNAKVVRGSKALFFLDGVAQRALWYWLLADATSEFAYEWTSAINEVACTPKEQQRPRAAAAGQSVIRFNNGFGIAEPSGVKYAVNVDPVNNGLQFTTGKQMAHMGFTYQIDAVSPRLLGENVTFEIHTDGGTDTETIVAAPGNSVDLVFSGRFILAQIWVAIDLLSREDITGTGAWYLISQEEDND